jgi:hypothetical protein
MSLSIPEARHAPLERENTLPSAVEIWGIFTVFYFDKEILNGTTPDRGKLYPPLVCDSIFLKKTKKNTGRLSKTSQVT